MVRHKDHTHLVYELELSDEPHRVQNALNIKQQGNFIVSVKNPEKGQPANAGLSKDQKADFPKKVMDKFEDRKFIPINLPDFMDYEFAELMLIGVDKEIKKELGIELKTQDENDSKADIFKELKIDKKEHPVEPLFEGEWK